MLTCMSNLFSCVRLFMTPWNVAHQASLSVGILQARILEWVAISFSRESSQPGASDSKEFAFSAGDLGLIPRLGRFPGE